MGAGALRAQSAMEFLMTYGWALLVLLVVVAVLFYVGVINPKNAQTNTLFFTPGFSAYSFRVGNGTGSLELDFGQATGKSVMVTAIYCSQNSSAALQDLNNWTIIPSGEHRWVTGGNSNNSVFCMGEDDQSLSPENAQSGGRYKGIVCVKYTEMDTYVNRTVCGDINAKFEFAPVPRPTTTAGGSPTPVGSPTPYPTPPPGAINITECGQTYDQPGYYYLDSDLNDTDTSSCITLTPGANNSILDCYDHTINSTNQWGGTGVYLQSTAGVTVRHCTLTNFGVGIYSEYSNYDTITDNSATSNYEGFYIYGSNNNNLTDNTVDSNVDIGLTVQSSSDNNLTGNTACWNQNQNMYCDSGENDGGGNICTPYGGTVCSSSITCHSTCPPIQLQPILISDCSSTYYISSPAYYYLDSDLNSAGSDCIDFNGGSYSTLDCHGHSITGTSQSSIGIYLNSVNGATIENCNVSNFWAGIILQGSSNDNIFMNNTANSNYEGIALWYGSTSNNIFTGNTASGNSDSGFYLGSANYNNFTGNTATGNTGGSDFFCNGDSYSNNDLGNTCNTESGCNVSAGGWLYTCPSGAPTPVPTPPPCTPPGGETGIHQCTARITSPGNYVLCGDMTCGNGPKIESDNVHLNCGHNLTGISSGSSWVGTGLTVNGNHATIENCSMSGFDTAIAVHDQYNVIQNNVLTSCGNYPIAVEGASYSNITGNTISSMMNWGIMLESSANHNRVTGNILTGVRNGIGLWYDYSSYNYIGNNTVTGGSYGITIADSSNNNFTGNTVTGNTRDFSCTDVALYPNNDSGNTCNTEGGCDAAVGGWLLSCPPGAPTPIPTPSPCTGPSGETGIYQCGTTISSSGNYVLCGDMSCANGVTIQANNVNLNCQGHSLTGFSTSSNWNGVGVYANNINGVTVENCNVSNFDRAIELLGTSSNNVITSNNVNSNNRGIGIYSSSGRNNHITGNTATSNNYGIDLEPSNNNIITGNTVSSSNYEAIYLGGSSGNSIMSNNFDSNSQYGIRLDSSNNNNITGNSANFESNYGIYASSSSGNNFSSNTACLSNSGSIYCNSAQNDRGGNICSPYPGTQCSSSITCNAGCPVASCSGTCTGGVCSGCGGTITTSGSWTLSGDVACGSCNGITITASNVVLDCGGHLIIGPNEYGGQSGISLNGVSGVTVENCKPRTFWIGIHLSSSSGNNLTGNTATADYWGFAVESASNGNSLTGNTVNGAYYGFGINGDNNQMAQNQVLGTRTAISLTGSNHIVTGTTVSGATDSSIGSSNSNYTNNNFGTTNIVVSGTGNRFSGNKLEEFQCYASSAQPPDSNNDDSTNTCSIHSYLCFWAQGSCAAPSAPCGDNRCSYGENSSSCCFDCGCPDGQNCLGNSCTTSTTITGCGWINYPGSYTLSPSFTHTTEPYCGGFGNACLCLNSSGITVDCQNHVMDLGGGGSTQAMSDGQGYGAGATIRNCDIRNTGTGISSYSALTIDNNTFTSMSQIALSVHGGTITNNRITSSAAGIGIFDTEQEEGFTISGNTMTGVSGYGIYLDGGSGSNGGNISNNDVRGASPGFQCYSSNLNNDGGGNQCSSQTGCSVPEGGWLYSCPPGAPTPTP